MNWKSVMYCLRIGFSWCGSVKFLGMFIDLVKKKIWRIFSRFCYKNYWNGIWLIYKKVL